MASSALEWCSVDTLKNHLSFIRDADGNFLNTDQDVTLLDCIQGAVSWCQQYTGLPLLDMVTTLYWGPVGTLTHPLVVRDSLYFQRVSAARMFPQEDIRTTQPTTMPVPTVYRKVSTAGREATWWIFPPSDSWPKAPGGYELDVVESVPVDEIPAVTNAAILVARDLFDGGNIMERRTTAQHILEPFRVIGG